MLESLIKIQKMKMMTAKIYNFKDYVFKKEERNRLAYGYSKELWNIIKENGYDVNDPSDIDQFFRDLEEE